MTQPYKTDVDFERNNRLVHSARLQVAKQLNHPPFGFALSIEKPFCSYPIHNGQKEYQLNLRSETQGPPGT